MKYSKKKRQQRAGEYRGIDKSLLDAPEYISLSPAAKLVLLHLRISLGPFGILVFYPAVTAAQTRYSEAEVSDALNELKQSKWIQTERNVIWVLDGLKVERSIHPDNEPHLTMAASHVATLPKLPIVRDFISRYPNWFTPEAGIAALDESDRQLGAMPGPLEAQNNREHQQIQQTRKQKPNFISSQPIAPLPAWWEPIAAVWKQNLSGSPQTKDQPIYERLVNAHGIEKVCLHLSHYLLSMNDPDQAAFISMRKFESTFGAYGNPDKKNFIKMQLEKRYGPPKPSRK
jgi:hypothetical protein